MPVRFSLSKVIVNNYNLLFNLSANWERGLRIGHRSHDMTFRFGKTNLPILKAGSFAHLDIRREKISLATIVAIFFYVS